MQNDLLEKLFRLKDKIAVITRAAGSIGSVLAESFADVGANVIICDINEEKMNFVSKRINARGNNVASIYLDLSCLRSIRLGVEKIKELFGGNQTVSQLPTYTNKKNINKKTNKILILQDLELLLCYNINIIIR